MTLQARHLLPALGLLVLGQPLALRAMDGTDEKLPRKSQTGSSKAISYPEFLAQYQAGLIQAPSRTPSAEELMASFQAFIGYRIRQEPDLAGFLPKYKNDPHQGNGYDSRNNSGMDLFLTACGIRSGHALAIWQFMDTCEADRRDVYLEVFEDLGPRINGWDFACRLQAILLKDGLWPSQQEVSSSSSSSSSSTSSSRSVLAVTVASDMGSLSQAQSAKPFSGKDEDILRAYLAWKLASLDGELTLAFLEEQAETRLVMDIFALPGKGIGDLKGELGDADQLGKLSGHLETFKALEPAIRIEEILPSLHKGIGFQFKRMENSSIFLDPDQFLQNVQESKEVLGNPSVRVEERKDRSSAERKTDSLT